MPSQPATEQPQTVHAVVLDQPESMGRPTLQRAKLFPDLASALAQTDMPTIAVIVRDPAVAMAAGLGAGQTAAQVAAAWKSHALSLLSAWRADRRRVVLIDANALEDRAAASAEAVRRRFGGILPIGAGTIAAPAPQPAMAQVLAWALTEQLPDLRAAVEEWRTAVIAGTGPAVAAAVLEDAVADWQVPRAPIATARPDPEVEGLRHELDQMRSHVATHEAVLALKCLADGAELARLRRAASAPEEVPPAAGPAPAARPAVAAARPDSAAAKVGTGAKRPAGVAIAPIARPASPVPAASPKPAGGSAGPAGANAAPATAAGPAGVAKAGAAPGPGAAASQKPAGANAKAAGAAKPATAAAKPGPAGPRPAGAPGPGAAALKPAGAAPKPAAKPAMPGGKAPAAAAKAPAGGGSAN